MQVGSLVGKILWRRKWQPTPVGLENPMDGEAWQATVSRVVKSQTQLKRLNTHTHTHTHKRTAGAGGARKPTAWVTDLGKLIFHSPSVLDENERGSAVERTGVRGGRD